MTWRQFANKCGYRGEGSIEKAIEVVNSMEEVNEEKINEYIDSEEEDFEDAHPKK